MAGDTVPILYLHTTSEVGGSDVSLVRLIEGLDRHRYRALVVLPSDGPLVSRLGAAGARVIIEPALRKLTSRRGVGYLVGWVLNFPRAVWRLCRLIRRERVGLVHTNTIHNLYGGPAAGLARTPHVWHIREIVWQKGWLRRFELWMTRHLASRIIVTSEGVAAMYGDEGRRPSTLVKVANGIETDRFMPGDEPALRAALGAGAADTLIGIACRLDVWKGVEVFLEAASQVAAARPHTKFVVVGGAIAGLERYAQSLKARAEALGLEGRLQWTDWQYGPADMPRVHRAFDIAVLASTEPEPFGLVIVEAMASGRPVVATAPGGPGELVDDGVTGLLIPPRDPGALARALLTLVDDPARARVMGEAGRRRVVERFAATTYVAAVQRVYADVLAEGRA